MMNEKAENICKKCKNVVHAMGEESLLFFCYVESDEGCDGELTDIIDVTNASMKNCIAFKEKVFEPYRVGAILNSEGKKINFLGYGEYVGDEVPPEDTPGFNMGMPNPKIVLDNGKVVWGCQCWWGPEEEIKKTLEKYDEIVDVDMDQALEMINREDDDDGQA